MKNKDVFLWSDNKIYLIVVGLLTIVISIYQPVLGMISALTLAYLIYFSFIQARNQNKKVKEEIENLSDTFESATKQAIFNMPFPLVIISESGNIDWYNTPFLNMITEKDILDGNIEEIISEFDLDDLLDIKEENTALEIKYKGEHYLVYPNLIKDKTSSASSEKMFTLYWVHNSQYVDLERLYKEEQSIVTLVYIDNYDDVRGSTPDINRPLLLAEIDKKITEYFSEYKALIRKYENDKYLIVINNQGLEKIQEKKFDLLDDIRSLEIGNTIPITLSIGVSDTGDSLSQSQKDAKAAIDIALGRGGDQAVINKEGSYEFYGGRSKALEKRNKVKSRVIGHALKQLIDQADRVFIMGHKNPDMDSLGASIGILRGVKNRNKNGYIILKEENSSIKNIFNRLREKQAELLDNIILPSEAEELITEESLMIMVDNHKPSFTEAPELLNLIEKTVIIDHHRRGAEFVTDPVLVYLEPYASSASELVTEILSYMSDNINLTKFEAEALLSGITVDTKNFSFQTGVRTFEAASILKRAGADTIAVRQLFRDEFTIFLSRAKIVSKSRIIYDKIAIGKLEEKMENSLLIAAQSANELLDVNGVEASFVLVYDEDRIHISGRSLGNISVQLILEELGGGGHLTSAGTQIMGVTIEEAEEKLIKAIEEHLNEEKGDI